MTKTKNRFLYLAAATALGLTLASCSGDTDGGETDAPEGDATATEQTDDAATDDAATEDEGADDAAASGGAECLIGTWEMTAEAMEEQVLATLGGEGEASVEGTSSMTFDGTTLTTAQDNTSSYSGEISGTAIETETTTDATIVVNYTADDAVLTYVDVVSAEGTISSTISGTTQEQDVADSAGAMAGMTQGYTCTDTELTLTTEAADLEVSLTLTRA